MIDESCVFQYEEPVMAGEPYRVSVKVEEAGCYGTNGVRVRIQSEEIPLDSKMLYYRIRRENLEQFKYYIPFNNQRQIDFFVKGVKPDEITLIAEASSLKLTNV